MESKILNFVEAMKLAKILDKYSIDFRDSPLNISLRLFQSLSQEDGISLLPLIMTKITPSISGINAISILTDCLSKNDIINLMRMYFEWKSVR